MQIKCPRCGQIQSAEVRFCINCGIARPVANMSASPTQSTVGSVLKPFSDWFTALGLFYQSILIGGIIVFFTLFLGGIVIVGKKEKEACVDINKSNKTSTQTNVSNSTLTSATTPSPLPQASLSELPKTPTPSAPSKMVKNLAIIEGVENNSGKVARISSLLTELDAKYPENSEQIGDMTAGAYGEITKKGQSASIIGIMEAMIEVAESKSKIPYADAVTSYALLRVNGMK
jgi:hypothetical protein